MAIYAIGDVQGCYTRLRALLYKICFHSDCDNLWFVGDLVNRGPESLGVLRFVRDLSDNAITVLGNHDLNLLAIAAGSRRLRPSDTIEDVLEAKDRDDLLDWLRQQPLMHYDADLDCAMVHASIHPDWSIKKALKLSAEVETRVRSEQCADFFAKMYGSKPDYWSDKLKGYKRLRSIINIFTRARYITSDGLMDYSNTDPPEKVTDDLTPWYLCRPKSPRATRVVFGHWSSLGCRQVNQYIATDSGCVWGGALCAVRLDDEFPVFFQVPCEKQR